MPISQMGKVIQRLRGAMLPRDEADLTDGQLLGRFIEQQDESAFAALVRRHGPMVLGVCRRLLHHHHDAEDAFQATFLVLVHKAAAVRPREMVGNWLYGVACRTALKARTLAARRDRREKQVIDMPEPVVTPPEPWEDLRPLLDQELSRLPDKFRVPIILCDLGGKSHKEAARHLGWPQGTVSGRLSVARAMLAKRLARRGLALSAGAVAVLLSGQTAAAQVPPALLSSTVKAASLLAAGKVVTVGAISANVAALTEGVLHAMLLTKCKIAALGVLVAVLIGLGTNSLTRQVLAERPASAVAAQERGRERAAQERGRDPAGPRPIAGKVVAVANDGKTISLEIPPAARGEDATKADFKITDKTAVLYMGVGPNGAHPTEGYFAQVRVGGAAKDVAVGVVFQGPEGRRGVDHVGRLIGAGGDGKSIVIEVAPKARGEEGQRLEIKTNDKTVFTYSNVPPGGAKLTEGYHAGVVLTDDKKANTAALVRLAAQGERRERGEREEGRPDLTGKVVAVADGGKTITVETQGRDEEAKKVAVKLDDKTAVTYHEVGPGGAKPAEGQRAMVWLAAGSKDSAARVVLGGVAPERWTIVVGKLVGFAKDGNTITLETPSQVRGEEPRRVEVKLTPETRISYSNVGPDEAKLTEGYAVRARLRDGSKDTAAEAAFIKAGRDGRGGGRDGERGRAAAVSGVLSAFDAAKRTVTLQSGGRGEPEKEQTYELTKEAKVIIHQGRKTREVQLADLVLKTHVSLRLDDAKKLVQGIDVVVSLTVSGHVAAVDEGNHTITLGGGRGETEEKTYDVAKDAKVFLRLPAPGERRGGADTKAGKLADAVKTQATLRLDDDLKVVKEIEVSLPAVRGTLRDVDATKRTLLLRPARGDDVGMDIAKDARVFIDGKARPLADLAVGAEVLLTLSGDRTKVLAIQAPPPEGR